MKSIVLPSGVDIGRENPVEFSLGDDHYLLLWPRPFVIPELDGASFLTVFDFDKPGPVDLDWLRRAVQQYITTDDVFRPDFLKAVLLLHTSRSGLDITNEAQSFLHEQGTTVVATHQAAENAPRLSPGPYYYCEGTLRPVWRLYEDTHNAFLQTLIPDQKGAPYKLNFAGSSPQSLSVAVPTRMQSKRKIESGLRPSLQGWRIAVKDNFQIQNVRMSACNRAYYDLYPPAEKTAACVERLCDAGAHVVGTTKLASFAATEEPMECIDWQAPFNPRADGYQSPAGSSSGSGVAAAAYSWLDITLGSDTSGSGRRPGHWNGCFAMRPSHGYPPHDGLLDSFPRFDVPTFFGRELATCKAFAEACMLRISARFAISIDKYKEPVSIVYAADYMSTINSKSQLDLIHSFVTDLEKTCQVQHEKISFEEVWQSDPPSQAKGATLLDYMRDVSQDSFFYEDFHNFDAFRKDYKDKFGTNPYISPPVRWQWELSCRISPEAHAEAMKRLEVYRVWFDKTVMKTGKRNTLVLIPIEEIAPRYRDEMPTIHFQPVGVPNLFLSPILMAPELTVPIGEYAYQSKVSGTQAKLPVAISIIGPPGQDIFVFNVVMKCLQISGRPDRVLSGRRLFSEVKGTL